MSRISLLLFELAGHVPPLFGNVSKDVRGYSLGSAVSHLLAVLGSHPHLIGSQHEGGLSWEAVVPWNAAIRRCVPLFRSAGLSGLTRRARRQAGYPELRCASAPLCRRIAVLTSRLA